MRKHGIAALRRRRANLAMIDGMLRELYWKPKVVRHVTRVLENRKKILYYGWRAI